MPTKIQTYHHGNLREALLEAAIDILNERGASGVTMREIGKAVGVSQSAAYRHFSDKSSLLAAIAEQGFVNLTQRLSKIREDDTREPYQRLEQMGISYVVLAVANAAQYRLMYGHEAVKQDEHPDLAKAARNMSHEVHHMVRLCIEAGQVHENDPRQVVHTIWSAAHGAATLIMDGFIDAKNPEDFAQRMVSHVGLGIKVAQG